MRFFALAYHDLPAEFDEPDEITLRLWRLLAAIASRLGLRRRMGEVL